MKENRPGIITNTFLKTVSAFANYDGGVIIFEADDNGNFSGIENPESVCLDIENRIKDSIIPQPEYTLDIGEKNTIELTVFSGDKTPYMYKSKAYKRNDTATVEVDRAELTRLILAGSNRHYEELPAENQKLTFRQLEKRLIAETGIDRCDINILKTLNLYSDKDGYNIAAALLADSNNYPGIDIGRFGESISVIRKRKTLDNISILAEYEAACEIFRDYYQYEIIVGSLRKTKELIPEEAFRETVANALIHRVWDVREQIRVFMFEDRIEVYSPGGLPEELSKEEYLAGNFSKLRNPIISNVFYRLRIVEIFGTGVRRIREAYKDSANKPEFRVYENSIKVVLPVMKSKNDLAGDEADVYKLLSVETGKPISDLVNRLPFGKSKTREILNTLAEKGFVYISGSGRGTKYHRK